MPMPENVKPYEFKPGQSGNPNGRPKGARSARDIYKRVGDMAVPDIVIAKLKEEGIDVEGKTMDEFIAYVTAARSALGNIAALRVYNERRFGNEDVNINKKLDISGTSSVIKTIEAITDGDSASDSV
jgi:hypothetical protein